MRRLSFACALMIACLCRGQAGEFLAEPGVQSGLAAIMSQALNLRAALPAQPIKAYVEPGPEYSVKGFDVSHYENNIQWDKLKGQGFSFVFIKATEGVDFVDQKFADNWKGAPEAGLARGAYHFYNFCAKGAAQADNFINTVPVDASAMPPTIDLEQSKSCPKLPAKAAFRKELSAFIDKIQAAYGKTPILYVNGSIYAEYFAGDTIDYPIWFANPREAPKLPDGKNWTFWQYAFHGAISGIEGDVDLDVFNGDKTQFADWVKTGGDSIGTLEIPQ